MERAHGRAHGSGMMRPTVHAHGPGRPHEVGVREFEGRWNGVVVGVVVLGRRPHRGERRHECGRQRVERRADGGEARARCGEIEVALRYGGVR